MVGTILNDNEISTDTESDQVLFKRKPITIHPPPTNVPDNAEVWKAVQKASELELIIPSLGLGHERDQ